MKNTSLYERCYCNISINPLKLCTFIGTIFLIIPYIIIKSFLYFDVEIDRQQPRSCHSRKHETRKNFVGDILLDRRGIGISVSLCARDVAPIFPPSPSLSHPSYFPLGGARGNGYTSRSIIRDFVEHTIPRESFTHAPPGNAVVAEKSNQTRAQDPRVLPAAGPKLPVLGGNERGGTRPHAQRGSDPARWKYILYLNAAATLLRAHFRCSRIVLARVTHLGQMEPYNRFISPPPFPGVSITTDPIRRTFSNFASLSCVE